MSNEIAVTFKVDDQDIKLTPKIVSEYLTGGAQITLPEFKMFTELCKVRGLNPFLKEAYIIKFGNNPAQIVVGKDAILKRAILNPNFDGRKQGIIVVDEAGQVKEKDGTFKLKMETLVGGWAKVFRKDWKYPVYVTVSFDEAAQRKRDGSLNQQWLNNPCLMIEKVALVRAMREAFVESIGGMFDEAEVEHTPPEKIIDARVIEQDIGGEISQEEPEIIQIDDVIDIDDI